MLRHRIGFRDGSWTGQTFSEKALVFCVVVPQETHCYCCTPGKSELGVVVLHLALSNEFNLKMIGRSGEQVFRRGQPQRQSEHLVAMAVHCRHPSLTGRCLLRSSRRVLHSSLVRGADGWNSQCSQGRKHRHRGQWFMDGPQLGALLSAHPSLSGKGRCIQDVCRRRSSTTGLV